MWVRTYAIFALLRESTLSHFYIRVHATIQVLMNVLFCVIRYAGFNQI